MNMHDRGGTVFCVAAALTCTLTGVASAQERVTLEEAIARAVQRGARLAEVNARRAGAEAGEFGAAAARMPVVSVAGGYTRTNHVEEFGIALPGQPLRLIYPDVPDNIRSRLDLQWPIYTGGRTAALEAVARAEKNALTEDLEALLADLRLEVTRAFWAAVTARETERVVSRAVQRMDVHVAALRVRLEQGLIPPNEVTSAEAQRSRQHLLAIEARNNRLVSDADLRRLIGGSGDLVPAADLGTATFIKGTGTSPSENRPENAPVPAEKVAVPLEKVAVTQRAELRGFEQRLRASRGREEGVRSTSKPQVAAVAGLDYARPNPRIFPRAARWEDSWDVGVNVAWTLWDGGRRKAEQAEAAAATRAVRARMTELERQIAFEVQQRELELDSSRAAITAAEDGVRSALETQRVLGERYRAGVATSTDVLDAEGALLQAELERTRALANQHLATARLARAAGR
ncbi:MAG: TolC family protein [Acidobacteria bacterium]|nr:TolC family protein [Acidobacteriota bacterium]